ncbi:hypothetical protein ACLOJK_035224 [Asimina triloba]
MAFSLFSHFLLARYTSTGKSIADEEHSITLFTWRPKFENADLARAVMNKTINSMKDWICDVVVVSRILNATLVIPELQSTTSSKGISSAFKSFMYLYNEDHFITALAKDIIVVKTLPKNFKVARRKKEIPVFKVPYSASPGFYHEVVLPVMKRHSVVELLVTDGGCLQAILPLHLEELQRLRCRVAFHALRFREEVQEIANRILYRLRASGRPFLAYDPGLTRDALAYHGCAELFQKIVDDQTQVDQGRSFYRFCEAVGILLRAYGYSSDTIIYISGGEVFGGQRILIPLHAMFENVVDRTSLTTDSELSKIYGHENFPVSSHHQKLPLVKEKMTADAWKKAGPRPRPLPPPPARPKYPYNIEGWWGWVAEIDKEPGKSITELRTNAHKLLWEAIDYVISVGADAYFPGFDRDGKGRPNFASLVMGHRLYQSAASKTFHPDRVVAKLLGQIHGHLYHANRTWLMAVRKHLNRTLVDGLTDAALNSKPQTFLSHPVPECLCFSFKHLEESGPSGSMRYGVSLGVKHHCPVWMDVEMVTRADKDKEREDDLDEDDSTLGQFFRGSDQEVGGSELSDKEESHMEDQEEEGGD